LAISANRIAERLGIGTQRLVHPRRRRSGVLGEDQIEEDLAEEDRLAGRSRRETLILRQANAVGCHERRRRFDLIGKVSAVVPRAGSGNPDLMRTNGWVASLRSQRRRAFSGS
jgi:hypothetical protein